MKCEPGIGWCGRTHNGLGNNCGNLSKGQFCHCFQRFLGLRKRYFLEQILVDSQTGQKVQISWSPFVPRGTCAHSLLCPHPLRGLCVCYGR